MKVKVIYGFTDRYTNEAYNAGDEIEVTEERMKEIESVAHLVEEIQPPKAAGAKSKRTAKKE